MAEMRRLLVGVREYEHSEWHQAWAIDAHTITWRGPLRGAIVALALVGLTIAIGRPVDGVPLVIGAVFAALADSGEVPGRRWRTMLWTTTWLCAGAALGGLSADIGWWQLLIVPVVAWTAGFAGAGGPRASLAGLLALVVFTVSNAMPMSGQEALRNVLLIGLGGLVQTLVTAVPTAIAHPSLLSQSLQRGESLMDRMRPHLDYGDDFVRHGLRLALAITVGTVIARLTGWPHEFWIPMTVAWTTRPGLNGTSTRVIQRFIGTILGIAASVVIIEGLHLQAWGLAVLVAAATYLSLAFIWANYPIAVVGITTLVIALLAMMGDPVGETAVIRIVATFIACIISILAALTWPARPRPPVPTSLTT